MEFILYSNNKKSSGYLKGIKEIQFQSSLPVKLSLILIFPFSETICKSQSLPIDKSYILNMAGSIFATVFNPCTITSFRNSITNEVHFEIARKDNCILNGTIILSLKEQIKRLKAHSYLHYE